MDIDLIIQSVQAKLNAVPHDQRTDEALEIGSKKKLVPWKWILINLVELLQRYPSGLSRPVVLNELQHSWELAYGTAWTGSKKRAKSHHVRHILDTCRVNPHAVLECEIRSIIALEDSKETWVAELVDSVEAREDFRELKTPAAPSASAGPSSAPSGVGATNASSWGPAPDSVPALPWLLHQKYYPLMPNSAQTLRRTSSRGLAHTITRARSIRSYAGQHLFVPGRKLKLTSCRLHSQWNSNAQKISILPNENVVILLNNIQEASTWPDFTEDMLKAPGVLKGPDGVFSFKATILSLPTLDLSNHISISQSIDNSTIFPSYSSTPPFLDIILSTHDAPTIPAAALRFFGPHIHLSSCLAKDDMLVLHMCGLISESHEFTSSQVSRSHFAASTSSSDAVPEPQTLRLPLFSYNAATLLMIVPSSILEHEEAMQRALDPEKAVLPATRAPSEPSPSVDLSYHGPKLEFKDLKPNCFNVTLVGYVVSVSRNQPSQAGFRRHGLRLQDTQSSSTSDLTMWENPSTTSSMTSSICPGHLLLLRGLSTDISRSDKKAVLVNLTAGDSKIVNLSLCEGFATSQPGESPHRIDISHLVSGSRDASEKPFRLFGPFIISQCSLSPATMVIPTSLHHNVCCRSVGQPNSMGMTTCSFCCDNQVDQSGHCSWQFDMDWTLEAHSEGKPIAVTVKAKPELASHLLKITATDFSRLSGAEQEMLVLHRANYPLRGTACVSRGSTGTTLLLDQFIPD